MIAEVQPGRLDDGKTGQLRRGINVNGRAGIRVRHAVGKHSVDHGIKMNLGDNSTVPLVHQENIQGTGRVRLSCRLLNKPTRGRGAELKFDCGRNSRSCIGPRQFQRQDFRLDVVLDAVAVRIGGCLPPKLHRAGEELEEIGQAIQRDVDPDRNAHDDRLLARNKAVDPVRVRIGNNRRIHQPLAQLPAGIQRHHIVQGRITR